MNQKMVSQLHELIEQRNGQYVNDVREESLVEDFIKKKINMNKERGAEIVRSFVEGDVIRTSRVDDHLYVDYLQRCEFLIHLKDQLYLEELVEQRRATFVQDELREDQVIASREVEQEAIETTANVRSFQHDQRTNRSYNRREAVRYAERWWDDFNPQYRKFTDNCTNFISQCLHAGGATMKGYPNRSNGWWFRSNNWSYSWSVAHALRWYLSGENGGLRGVEKESAMELEPGDVICYDFNGDGRWQHTTIVVDKDANGEPLVNAQTANSRMRYWKYEDSTAWTPNIKYKFFHITI
ncbi:amidase domain-containing protein [Alkalihalobacillus sp. MEB130]|uniref:amidase domain-containing protein n=1 Tax=Alkalihalobacillus sp. MEB130 TaxID=2976704 RepID=UPI0028DE51CD|nr:amidase domain-containing protein [Alkalihalobacillus sp. MEB130]MDT8862367.1 amidase domain-containing protein [Alkalihalobacillus sp. MEB130]